MIVVKNLQLKFRHNVIFENLSFSLEKRQILCLVGANGSGKTSLLKCIAGLVPYAQGEVLAEAKPCYFSTVPSLLLDRTVFENIELMCNMYFFIPTKSQILSALDRIGLGGRENQVCRSLSTGQKRRLTLAVLIVLKPPLILADEPSIGLDAEGENLCLEIFKELSKNSDSGIIFASHDEKIMEISSFCLKISNFVPKVHEHKKILTKADIFQ
jgi:ABC-type multidrug transport system ATPase subunit